MFDNDKEMRRCIAALQECQTACLQHISYDSKREQQAEGLLCSLMDCAEICQIAISFLVRDSNHYLRICLEVVEICRDLASNCEGVDGMEGVLSVCDECVSACRVIVG